MRRCASGDVGLNDYGQPLREEELAAIYDKLVATWSPMFPIGVLLPSELKAERMKQKILLGRYAHQDIRVWEDRPVIDLDRAIRALREIMNDEHPVTAHMETKG